KATKAQPNKTTRTEMPKITPAQIVREARKQKRFSIDGIWAALDGKKHGKLWHEIKAVLADHPDFAQERKGVWALVEEPKVLAMKKPRREAKAETTLAGEEGQPND